MTVRGTRREGVRERALRTKHPPPPLQEKERERSWLIFTLS